MTIQKLGSKKVGQMTISDFIAQPIWTWADEDDGTVMPVECSGVLPETHDALFLVCEFRLANGDPIPGALAVRVADRQVYMLSFFAPNGNIIDFPLQPALRSMISREQLASSLQMACEDVFPVRYTTAYKFADGRRIAGQIE